MGKVLWRKRGYLFDSYSFDADWNPVGGIYVFSGFNPASQLWEVFYAGKTESFRGRICLAHDKWFPAMLLGATHVLAMPVPQAYWRAEIERELIEEFQPPLNEQLRSKPADLWQLLFPIPGFGLSR